MKKPDLIMFSCYIWIRDIEEIVTDLEKSCQMWIYGRADRKCPSMLLMCLEGCRH
ncbi:MAG: hypothetical protein V8R14_03310 [Clostridia bacterium]